MVTVIQVSDRVQVWETYYGQWRVRVDGADESEHVYRSTALTVAQRRAEEVGTYRSAVLTRVL